MSSHYGQVEIETTEAELLTFMEGINWSNVARPVHYLILTYQIRGRSPIECQIQWTVHDHPYINHAPFTEEEKNLLATIIETNDARNWQLIAQEHGVNVCRLILDRTVVSPGNVFKFINGK